MMRYEMMTITKSKLGEEGSTNLSNTIKDLISAQKGKILNSDSWGKRNFSYPVDHATQGFYEVIEFEVDPSAVVKIRQKMDLNEDLLRYLIVKN